ncbi:hypothetical protein ACFC1T_09105 [Kitasatospora sp. NPDC056076]|uniref:hypothetical protein n=1 Tax=Kitasatospora sp. NPDC056076 TaxID=3345703 RepID=UPI0035DF201F
MGEQVDGIEDEVQLFVEIEMVETVVSKTKASVTVPKSVLDRGREALRVWLDDEGRSEWVDLRGNAGESSGDDGDEITLVSVMSAGRPAAGVTLPSGHPQWESNDALDELIIHRGSYWHVGGQVGAYDDAVELWEGASAGARAFLEVLMRHSRGVVLDMYDLEEHAPAFFPGAECGDTVSDNDLELSVASVAAEVRALARAQGRSAPFAQWTWREEDPAPEVDRYAMHEHTVTVFENALKRAREQQPKVQEGQSAS